MTKSKLILLCGLLCNLTHCTNVQRVFRDHERFRVQADILDAGPVKKIHKILSANFADANERQAIIAKLKENKGKTYVTWHNSEMPTYLNLTFSNGVYTIAQHLIEPKADHAQEQERIKLLSKSMNTSRFPKEHLYAMFAKIVADRITGKPMSRERCIFDINNPEDCKYLAPVIKLTDVNGFIIKRNTTLLDLLEAGIFTKDEFEENYALVEQMYNAYKILHLDPELERSTADMAEKQKNHLRSSNISLITQTHPLRYFIYLKNLQSAKFEELGKKICSAFRAQGFDRHATFVAN